jgi:hypothetical protein
MIRFSQVQFALIVFISFFVKNCEAQSDTFKTSMSPYIGLSLGLPMNSDHILINAEWRPFNRKYSLNYFGTYSKITLRYPSFFGALSGDEEETIISLGISKMLIKKFIIKRRLYINLSGKIGPYTERKILFNEDSTTTYPRIIGSSFIGSLNLVVNLHKKFAVTFTGDLSYNKNIFQFEDKITNREGYFRSYYWIGIMYFFK